MRRCGVCKLAFRANDPGGTCTVPADNEHNASPGHYSACSECCAKYDPSPHFALIVSNICTPFDHTANRMDTYFHPLVGVPRADGQEGVLSHAPPWYCAMCRRCAREDDRMEMIRLRPEDAPDEPGLFNRRYRITIGEIGPIEVEDLNEAKAVDWFRRRFSIHDGEAKVEQLEGLYPAAYYACGECRRKHAPKVMERLKREKIIPAETPVYAINPFLMG